MIVLATIITDDFIDLCTFYRKHKTNAVTRIVFLTLTKSFYIPQAFVNRTDFSDFTFISSIVRKTISLCKSNSLLAGF